MPSRVRYRAGLPVTGQSVGTFSIARLFGKLFSKVSLAVSKKNENFVKNRIKIRKFLGGFEIFETVLDQKILKNDRF